jgi:hypothetical protein
VSLNFDFVLCGFCARPVGSGKLVKLMDILVSVTSLIVKHPLLDVERLKIYLRKERKETERVMFEEFSISAGQTLVALFWLILAVIFIWALACRRTQPK